MHQAALQCGSAEETSLGLAMRTGGAQRASPARIDEDDDAFCICTDGARPPTRSLGRRSCRTCVRKLPTATCASCLVGIEDWWRNEQFWVIGGVSAHLFAVFQGILKMIAGLDTNFTVTAKATDDTEFGELYVFKWTTVLIPPTSILVLNLVGVVAGFSAALNSGYESWGPLFGKVFFAMWVIMHLYPFLKGLMGRQNRTPTIVVLWSVLLASVFSLLWVKIDPFVGGTQTGVNTNSCNTVIC
jgi:hypothetical protein